jgi:hypothetical protein
MVILINNHSIALCAGFTIGIPPLHHFGKKVVTDRVIPELLSGNKRICLAISD